MPLAIFTEKKHKLNFDSNQIIAAIKEFKGLNHRMQILGEVDGVKFINDSKATNADSSGECFKIFLKIFLDCRW